MTIFAFKLINRASWFCIYLKLFNYYQVRRKINCFDSQNKKITALASSTLGCEWTEANTEVLYLTIYTLNQVEIIGSLCVYKIRHLKRSLTIMFGAWSLKSR